MNEPMHKSDAINSAVQSYRFHCLQLLTPKWMWALLGLAIGGAQIVVLVTLDQPWISGTAALVTLGLGYLIFDRIRYDNEIRFRARMTPVFDRAILKGQIGVLKAGLELLESAIQIRGTESECLDRERISRAVTIIETALAPLLGRAGLDPRNAKAPGYPGNIERSREDGVDFYAFHLKHAQTSVRRLEQLMEQSTIFSETAAYLASHIVPPLRAIEEESRALQFC